MTQQESLTDTKVETTAVQPEVIKNTPSQEEVSTEPKTYTQEQVDAIASKIRKTEESKVLRKFEGVDVEKYQSLIAKEEQAQMAEQKRKGEFEKILQQQAEKANARIQSLTGELTKIKVDGALLSSASTKKAINPEQVVRLVRDQVKMSETGQVEIVDPKSGNTRYTEAGEPLDVENAVSDWLKANPHFVQAGPTGSGATSNQNPEGVKQVDLDKLDLTKAKDREIYKQHRAKLFGSNTL